MEPIKDIDLSKDWSTIAEQMKESGGFVAKKFGIGVDILEKMLKENVGSILVKRGEDAVGIITINDLVRATLNRLDFDETTASGIMSSPLETCERDDDLDLAMKKFEASGRSRLIVMHGGKVAGILKKSIAERFKGVSGIYNFSPRTRSLPFRRGSGSSQG